MDFYRRFLPWTIRYYPLHASGNNDSCKYIFFHNINLRGEFMSFLFYQKIAHTKALNKTMICMLIFCNEQLLILYKFNVYMWHVLDFLCIRSEGGLDPQLQVMARRVEIVLLVKEFPTGFGLMRRVLNMSR